MKMYLLPVIALILYSCASAQIREYTGNDAAISRQGRTIIHLDGVVELISSASIIGFQFKGDACTVLLSNITAAGDYNYVAVEMDDKYDGRLRVSGSDPEPFILKPDLKMEWHTLRIYKATEASNGIVAFHSAKATDIKPLATLNRKKFEFIGNSITCGMGNDLKDIPCGKGSKWFDQHNAYWSYASITARTLGADFMLSSISGAGIYRNWNSDGPTVPQQYESAYLQIDSTRRWDFKFYTPDIVTVALGTNDLSLGDGSTQRLPFDSDAFIREYVNFIGTIYSHYPKAQLVLLTSPMVRDKRADVFYSCLQTIKSKAAIQYPNHKTIKVFRFEAVPSSGCSGHPNIEEHKMMAKQLISFMQKL